MFKYYSVVRQFGDKVLRHHDWATCSKILCLCFLFLGKGKSKKEKNLQRSKQRAKLPVHSNQFYVLFTEHLPFNSLNSHVLSTVEFATTKITLDSPFAKNLWCATQNFPNVTFICRSLSRALNVWSHLVSSGSWGIRWTLLESTFSLASDGRHHRHPPWGSLKPCP